MSIPKSVALLGMGRENLRLIPTGQDFHLIHAELEKAIQADKAVGKTPIAVVASAGTVNTGAIDPLPEIADIARQQSWQTQFRSIPTSGCFNHWIADVCFIAMLLPPKGPSLIPEIMQSH